MIVIIDNYYGFKYSVVASFICDINRIGILRFVVIPKVKQIKCNSTKRKSKAELYKYFDLIINQ